MGMICMNTKSHHKLLLYLLWSLLELWHGLGIVVLQESIVVFAVKIKKGINVGFDRATSPQLFCTN